MNETLQTLKKVWTREPLRNVLSKQEYRPAQQNREIK